MPGSFLAACFWRSLQDTKGLRQSHVCPPNQKGDNKAVLKRVFAEIEKKKEDEKSHVQLVGRCAKILKSG